MEAESKFANQPKSSSSKAPSELKDELSELLAEKGQIVAVKKEKKAKAKKESKIKLVDEPVEEKLEQMLEMKKEHAEVEQEHQQVQKELIEQPPALKHVEAIEPKPEEIVELPSKPSVTGWYIHLVDEQDAALLALLALGGGLLAGGLLGWYLGSSGDSKPALEIESEEEEEEVVVKPRRRAHGKVANIVD